MKTSPSSILHTALAALLIAAGGLHAAAITVPWTAPISSTSIGSDLANAVHGGTTAIWAVGNSGSDNYYQYTSGSTNGSSTSVWQTSNITGATTINWSETVKFTITDYSSAANIGLIALAQQANSLGFVADVNNTSMRILALGPNTSIATGTFTGTALNTVSALGLTYTATLSGSYSGSTLTLTYSLSDGTNTQSISGTASGLTLTANNFYFGVRNNYATSGDTLAIRYSSIAIVPEPSTAALLGACGLGTMLFFRRRKA